MDIFVLLKFILILQDYKIKQRMQRVIKYFVGKF